MAVDYSSEVLGRFRSPRAPGELLPNQGSIVSGEAEDRTLNVWIRMQLEIIDTMIARASYRVFGCPHTVAAADWIAEWLEGRRIAEVGQLDIHQVACALDVPVQKLGKLLCVEDALLECIERLAASESIGNR